MELLTTIAVLICLAAGLGYVNTKLLKLPTTIGLMLLSLGLSLLAVALSRPVPAIGQVVSDLLGGIDFNQTLMHGMLGFLLFAGALHVNLNDLKQQKIIIALLATVGVVATTLIVGLFTFLSTRWLGIQMQWIYCLLFGALIAPTDPIAVLAILKKLGAPKTLETKIAGESLFNDGVGVVVFMALLGFAGLSSHGEAADSNAAISAGHIALVFLKDVAGGALFGLVLGMVGFFLLKSLDEYKTEILISLAMVTGGYALCVELHISGPIAMVVAGLLIGNHGRSFAMSDKTRQHLDMFWELVDEILNAVLFVLIGLEVFMVIKSSGMYFLAGLVAIPATLAARFIAVSGLVRLLAIMTRKIFTPHAAKIMTWAGLRGGISVALALWLHHEADTSATQAILAMTYVVVVFSIVVQGLTVGPLMRRLGVTTQPSSGQ